MSIAQEKLIRYLEGEVTRLQEIVDKNSAGYQLLEALRDTHVAKIKELEEQIEDLKDELASRGGPM